MHNPTKYSKLVYEDLHKLMQSIVLDSKELTTSLVSVFAHSLSL